MPFISPYQEETQGGTELLENLVINEDGDDSPQMADYFR